MPGTTTRARAKGAAATAARGGTVLVTVGTTRFDALVAAVDDPAVAEALAARGYAELVLQACRNPTPSPYPAPPCTHARVCPENSRKRHPRQVTLHCMQRRRQPACSFVSTPDWSHRCR